MSAWSQARGEGLHLGTTLGLSWGSRRAGWGKEGSRALTTLRSYGKYGSSEVSMPRRWGLETGWGGGTCGPRMLQCSLCCQRSAPAR